MVSEICEISNYPRATFYNYFEDKYDLLNYCWDCFGEKIDFQNDYDYMDTDEKMYDLFNNLYDFFEKILREEILCGLREEQIWRRSL